MPETISSESIYDGRIFDVRIDTLRHEGSEYKREVVVHRGSAVIVPLFDDNSVALVRQYRHAAGEYLLEIPAGTLDPTDDTPEQGARRELEEEIGVIAENIEKIAEFYVSPGFLTEKMYVYLATGLTETQQNLDDDEHVEIERISLDRALEMTKTGEIADAKTIIGLTFAAEKLKQVL